LIITILDIQYVHVTLSGSQLGLVIKNKNDQFHFVLYPMDLTHICSSFIDDRWYLLIYGHGIHKHFL
ncbi:unnamed protein product, partial [Rotaria sp. Silwood1]